MTDKIAEIRERHERIDAWVKETRTFGPTAAHTDRATLLAEVERLRADAMRYRCLKRRDHRLRIAEIRALKVAIPQLQAAHDAAVRERAEARAEVERLREALKTVRDRCTDFFNTADAVSEVYEIAVKAMEVAP